MSKTLINIAGSNAIFERGRRIAKLAERGQSIRKSHLITFQDSDDIASLVTVSNINLLSAIREKPSTIATMTKRLQRYPRAVRRNLVRLEQLGLVTMQDVQTPGQPSQQLVYATSTQVFIQI